MSQPSAARSVPQLPPATQENIRDASLRAQIFARLLLREAGDDDVRWEILKLKPPKKGCEAEHDRLLQIYFQYLQKFRKPTFPEELQMEPEHQGVEILSRENQ